MTFSRWVNGVDGGIIHPSATGQGLAGNEKEATCPRCSLGDLRNQLPQWRWWQARFWVEECFNVVEDYKALLAKEG
ncbi:hypothetical protein GCM10023097_01170 [Streptomyces collinus]